MSTIQVQVPLVSCSYPSLSSPQFRSCKQVRSTSQLSPFLHTPLVLALLLSLLLYIFLASCSSILLFHAGSTYTIQGLVSQCLARSPFCSKCPSPTVALLLALSPHKYQVPVLHVLFLYCVLQTLLPTSDLLLSFLSIHTNLALVHHLSTSHVASCP